MDLLPSALLPSSLPPVLKAFPAIPGQLSKSILHNSIDRVSGTSGIAPLWCHHVWCMPRESAPHHRLLPRSAGMCAPLWLVAAPCHLLPWGAPNVQYALGGCECHSWAWSGPSCPEGPAASGTPLEQGCPWTAGRHYNSITLCVNFWYKSDYGVMCLPYIIRGCNYVFNSTMSCCFWESARRTFCRVRKIRSPI